MPVDGQNLILHQTSYFNALRASIIKAKKQIFITSYVVVLNRKKKSCPTNKLFLLLLSKLKAGIDVRWVVDHPRKHKSNYHATQYLIRRLKINQIPFWIAPPRNTLHSKVIIIDESKVFLGSHNLTRSSYDNPLEVSVEIDSTKVCESLTVWFTGLCNDPSFESYPPGNYTIPDIYP